MINRRSFSRSPWYCLALALAFALGMESAGAAAAQAPATKRAAPATKRAAPAPKLAVPPPEHNPATEVNIEFWHSMDGELREQVERLTRIFNGSQSGYRVVPLYRGTYDEAMNAALAAQQTGAGPHIVQVFEVGTATMMAAKKAIKPVYQLMADAKEKFDAAAYIPAVSSVYADSHGKLLSLPFNSSTAVFYYNKDAFIRAGLDPAKPPQTWRDVLAAALKLQDATATPCGLTTDWQSWIHLENLGALHNQPLATRNNGFGGLDTKLTFNGELLIRHLSLLSTWAKSDLFVYSGRGNEGEAKFFGGECGMLTGSSAAYGNIAANARFEFAVADMPYYDEYKGAPFNPSIGGASLWVLNGKKPDTYRGVAKFFAWLSQPQVQAEWHQRTGYLPITRAAYELTRKQGFYEKHPGAEIPVKQILRKPESFTRGLRLGNFVQIRAVFDEELEQVWSGKKTPIDALDAAVERGNELLRQFEKAHK